MIQPIDDCEHGPGVERSGVGRSSGKAFRGEFCPENVTGCQPVWLEPRQAEIKAAEIVEQAKQTCRNAIALARRVRDEAITKAMSLADEAEDAQDKPPF